MWHTFGLLRKQVRLTLQVGIHVWNSNEISDYLAFKFIENATSTVNSSVAAQDLRSVTVDLSPPPDYITVTGDQHSTHSPSSEISLPRCLPSTRDAQQPSAPISEHNAPPSYDEIVGVFGERRSNNPPGYDQIYISWLTSFFKINFSRSKIIFLNLKLHAPLQEMHPAL